MADDAHFSGGTATGFVGPASSFRGLVHLQPAGLFSHPPEGLNHNISGFISP